MDVLVCIELQWHTTNQDVHMFPSIYLNKLLIWCSFEIKNEWTTIWYKVYTNTLWENEYLINFQNH